MNLIVVRGHVTPFELSWHSGKDTFMNIIRGLSTWHCMHFLVPSDMSFTPLESGMMELVLCTSMHAYACIRHCRVTVYCTVS